MSFESSSPNMSMPVPGVSLTSGPQYAADINACLSIIDQHDHSPGAGVQITPAGLNINSDLTFNNTNNLTNARSVRFNAQNTPLAGVSDLGSIYVSGVDLFYNDENGNQIQITDNGGVAGTPGSIANLVPPASASYVSINSTFVWQSNANTPANMDAASYIFRNLVVNSFGLTLAPPAAMTADFTLTLPNIPASTKIMQLDNAGNMSAVLGVDNVTIEISSNNLQVKDGGITAAKIANHTITPLQLASTAIQDSYQIAEFAASGTFVVPAGVTIVYVTGTGGGGGGGGGAGSGGAAGGGGGGQGAPWYENIRKEVTPGASLAVVIGAGGAGGVGGINPANGNPGSSGTATTFSGLIFRGGLGGGFGINGGAGGAGGSDYFNGAPIFGAPGGSGNSSGAGQAGGASMWVAGGAGGASGNASGGGGGGGSSLGQGGTGGNSGSPAGQVGTVGGANGGGGGGGGGAFAGGNGGSGGNGGRGYLRINWFESI